MSWNMTIGLATATTCNMTAAELSLKKVSADWAPVSVPSRPRCPPDRGRSLFFCMRACDLAKRINHTVATKKSVAGSCC